MFHDLLTLSVTQGFCHKGIRKGKANPHRDCPVNVLKCRKNTEEMLQSLQQMVPETPLEKIQMHVPENDPTILDQPVLFGSHRHVEPFVGKLRELGFCLKNCRTGKTHVMSH